MATPPPTRHSSPLLEAIELNDLKMLQWLLKQGAKTNIKQIAPDFFREGTEDIDVASYACKKGYIKLSNFLLGFVDAPITRCSKQIDKNQMISVNKETVYGVTYMIGKQQNLRIKKRMQNKLQLIKEDQLNISFISRTVETENLSLTKYLVAKGAFLSDRDYGGTLLHTAARTANRTMMSYLITQGLSVNDKDINGKTPLTRAVESGDIDSVVFLLNSGAKIQGSGAIASAQEFKYKRIEHLLKDALRKEKARF